MCCHCSVRAVHFNSTPVHAEQLETMCRSSGGYSSSGGGGYASDRGGGYASCSSDGEGLTSEAKSLKRRKFEQRRKQHYNMREALQK